MTEKLRQIRECYEILKEEEDIIRKKGVNYENYEIDLQALEDLRRELNNMAINIIQEESQINQLKEKIELNKTRLETLENMSKKQYPKIEGRDKTRKKDILERSGFISTERVDGREAFIARSLVGQYYDLVKETRRLQVEYNNLINQRNNTQSTTNLEPEKIIPLESLTTNEEPQQTASVAEQRTSLEENISSIKEQIIKLLEERNLPNQGKKTTIRFEGNSYIIPRKRKGEFNALNTQYNSLRKKLRELNSNVIDFMSYAPAPTPVETRELDGQNTSTQSIGGLLGGMSAIIKPENEEEQPTAEETAEQQQSEGVGASVEKQADSEQSVPVSQESRDKLAEEIIDVVAGLTSPDKLTQGGTGEQPEGPESGEESPSSSLDDEDRALEEMFRNRPPRESGPIYDWKQEGTGDEEEQDEEEEKEEQAEEELVGSRPPKFITKIKDWVKKHKRIIAGVVGALMIGGAALGIIKLNSGNNSQSQIPTEPTTSTVSDDLENTNNEETTYELPEMPTIITDQQEEFIDSLLPQEDEELLGPEISIEEQKESSNNEETETYSDASQDILIGGQININDGSRIYATAADSILEENSYNPYYNSSQDRVVLGVSIEHNGNIVNVLANTENYNQKIIDLLSDGGQIVSVLTAAQDKVTQNFDGQTPMTSSEINEVAEGFYNIGSVSNNNERGRSR